ncbi:release factor glutamine methyltransferase [Calothrix sp. NIES-4101]|nr:release factor glutamine methyltransferase [Calothrix sp. NIES-4101]
MLLTSNKMITTELSLPIIAREYLKETPYGQMEFGDRDIIVLPTVFPPDINTLELAKVTSRLVRKFLETNHQCRVFEMGVGSGGAILSVAQIPGIIASGSDISPMAVLNAQVNALWWGAKCDIYHSNLFDNVPKNEFDIIFWNIPWLCENPGEIEDIRFKAGFDPGYQDLQTFLSDVNQWLAPGGSILLAIEENFCNLDAIDKLIDQANFQLEIFDTTQVVWQGMDLQLIFIQLVPRAI